jgi:uncharacterized protein YndB with AHSA1/START domain
MHVMGMKHSPIAKAEVLIRKPVAEVFEAFVNPTITASFWFFPFWDELSRIQIRYNVIQLVHRQ